MLRSNLLIIAALALVPAVAAANTDHTCSCTYESYPTDEYGGNCWCECNLYINGRPDSTADDWLMVDSGSTCQSLCGDWGTDRMGEEYNTICSLKQSQQPVPVSPGPTDDWILLPTEYYNLKENLWGTVHGRSLKDSQHSCSRWYAWLAMQMQILLRVASLRLVAARTTAVNVNVRRPVGHIPAVVLPNIGICL